jgi:hypothetical protein
MLLHQPDSAAFPDDSEAHFYIIFIMMRKMREMAHR